MVAQQWMWKLQHPEGPREINQLHVPVDRDIKLVMTSQDVIHSFFVPAFRIKQDVLPGRYTTLGFTPPIPGPITCSARSIAAPSFRHDRAGDRDGAPITRLGWRAEGPAEARRKPGATLFSAWDASPATARTRRAAGPT